MKHTTLITAVLLALAAVVVAETIEDTPEAVSLYEKGKRLLREGEWLQASRTFEELSGRFSTSPNLDLFLFNRAKADYYFGDYNDARAGFANFAARFPKSRLAAHALFYLGNIAYVRGHSDLAFAHYLEAYASSGDPRLAALIESSLAAAVAQANQVQISALDFASVPDSSKCDLMARLAEVLSANGHLVSARRLLAACDLDAQGKPVTPGSLRSSLRLALVLPFSGELESFASDIYNGATLAAEEYREETGFPISLHAYDTQGDPIDAGRIVRELSGGGVDAVIGPLTSEEASVASAAMSCGGVPLIAPAATEAGLTRLSDNSFQLSPNLELQGVQMAEYAANRLNADSAVIVTSTESTHLRMARAFARQFEALGGTVAAIEYYRPRDKDFGPVVRDVKGLLLGEQPDSAFFIDEFGDTLDLDVVPARVDCIYLPGSPNQLRLLVPQLHFYNLSGALLGSDGWGDEAVYRLGDKITKRAVFPSPFILGEQSEASVRFAATFDTRFGERPNRLARLGYDAVRLVASIAQREGVSRDRLVAAISQIQEFEGASGTITFGDSRENVAMPLYRIEGEQPVFLGIGRAVSYGPADQQ